MREDKNVDGCRLTVDSKKKAFRKNSGKPLFINPYCRLNGNQPFMASAGHADAQAPQSVHLSASIL
jgi:hypothetical protein